MLGTLSCPLSPRPGLWPPAVPARPALPVTACSASSAEAPEFDVHLGYEADLLTAFEAMPGACAPLTTATMWSWVDNRHHLTLPRTSAVFDTASPG